MLPAMGDKVFPYRRREDPSHLRLVTPLHAIADELGRRVKSDTVPDWHHKPLVYTLRCECELWQLPI